jgi:hypothetical protein
MSQRWEELQRLNAEQGYDLSDFAGIAELADDIFHVSRSVICNWNSRFGGITFPPPVLKFRATPVYSVQEYLIAWQDWETTKGEKVGKITRKEEKIIQAAEKRLEESCVE